MKKPFHALILISSSFAMGQVGINTETPQETLHVNGNMQVTKGLSLGGTETTKGNFGTNGQVLTSAGENNAPIWTNATAGSSSSAEISDLTFLDQSGELLREKVVAWGEVKQSVKVTVTTAGAYHFFTDKQNGVRYEALGLFEKTGEYTIDLLANGTPKEAGNFKYTLIQPHTITSNNSFYKVTSVNNGSGNTIDFGYKLSYDKQYTDASKPINITLSLENGTAPVNREVRWYVNNVEYLNNMGDVSLVGDVMTITKQGKATVSVYAKVVDADTPSKFYMTSEISMDWRVPFIWGVGEQVGNKVVYMDLWSGQQFETEDRIPSNLLCKEKFGQSATLSTVLELQPLLSRATYQDAINKFPLKKRIIFLMKLDNEPNGYSILENNNGSR